jgi:phenylpropionate dioxygenase-like ring-hydroxylating dioxygenase large terminal subunit
MNRRFPFSSFPNGWFRVAYSDDLPPKEVMPLHYFGKDLVLFRAEDGTPHIFDAHCPHLGAHLGYGGKVEGNTIRCPFHGWGFNCEGNCVDIPYARKVPSRAQMRCCPVCEINGLIMDEI